MLVKWNRNWYKLSSLKPQLYIRRNANKEYVGYTFAWLFIFVDHLKWFRHLRFGGNTQRKERGNYGRQS